MRLKGVDASLDPSIPQKLSLYTCNKVGNISYDLTALSVKRPDILLLSKENALQCYLVLSIMIFCNSSYELILSFCWGYPKWESVSLCASYKSSLKNFKIGLVVLSYYYYNIINAKACSSRLLRFHAQTTH